MVLGMKWLKLILILLIAIAIIGAAVFFFFFPKAPAVQTVPNDNGYFSGGTGTGASGQTPGAGGVVPIQATSTPTAAMEQSPADFAKGFYTWYLNGLVDNFKFSSSNDFTSSEANWLTPNFATNWQNLAAQTDANPFLLAQDYQNSWASDITASAENQSATSSAVLVTLGASSPSPQKVTAHLMSANGTWLIDSITPAP